MSLNIKIFAVTSLLLGAVVVGSSAELRFPGGNQGYEPEQPIAFSHRIHAGDLSMECEYCHYGARNSRYAGVPSASVCMNCHESVTSGFDAKLAEKERAEIEAEINGGAPAPNVIVSGELAKLYEAVAWDPIKGQPIEGGEAKPIEWVGVYNMPDFVYFDHRPHVARGVDCQTCHGPVETMERMRQDAPLTMGWCIECHRSNAYLDGPVSAAGQRLNDHVSTNCVTCHL